MVLFGGCGKKVNMYEGSLIVAMNDNRIIGVNGSLPWHLPGDLKIFKQHTLGKAVLMGYKTFASLDFKPLPDRLNLVLTSKDLSSNLPNLKFFNDWENMVSFAQSHSEWVVIGGSSLYLYAIDQVNKLYISWVDALISGDVLFPSFDLKKWRLVYQDKHPQDNNNKYSFNACIYVRGNV